LPKHPRHPPRRRSRGLVSRRHSPRSAKGRGADGAWPAPDCTPAGRIRRPASGAGGASGAVRRGLEVEQDSLDVALRIDRPDDPAVITRKIASTRRIICAAPAYLATHGIPERPADLASHECLRLARRHRLHDRWRFRFEAGFEEVKVGGHLSSGSGDALHGWALEGRGLSAEALWDVADDLEAGRLVECLADHWCDDIELFATFLPGHPLPPRIRLFVDFMVAAHLN
jgi:DNA-binding transcriptional LysR family regulator